MNGEVVEQDEQVPQPAPAGKSKEPETVAIPKAEWERVQRQVSELTESERYWAGKARHAEPEPEPEPDDVDLSVYAEDDEDKPLEGDTPDKLVDEFATNGINALKKRGFITAADAKKLAADIALKVSRELVDRRVQTMQADSQLVGSFGDLRDKTSELFQTAAPIYQDLVKMNGGKQSTALLYAAAGQARAILDAKKPAKQARNEDPYDRYEDDRRARADAQGAARGRRAAPPEEEAVELGPEAREICKAMGISQEDWLASNKEVGRRGRRG